MKLTPEQHTIILRYLIREGLKYKEFIDEVRDHFIDSIEAKMSEGLKFQQALHTTGEAFENEVYYRWKINFLPVRGLRALEKKYLQSCTKGAKQEFYQILKKDPFSVANILIMCVAVVLGVAVYRELISSVSLIFIATMSFFWVFTYMLYKAIGKVIFTVGVMGLFLHKPSRRQDIGIDTTVRTFQKVMQPLFWASYIVFIISIQNFPLINNLLTPTVNAYLSLGLLAVLLVYSAAMLQFIHRKNFAAK